MNKNKNTGTDTAALIRHSKNDAALVSHPYKSGYLNTDFRIFYLTNAEARDFQSHYHDFHKLLLFESGSLSYSVEGEMYQLQPYDIVLVPAGEVHRPVIHDQSPYRRLIIYISPEFFSHYQAQGIDLFYCFSSCSNRHSHVLRLNDFRASRMYPQFQELIHTVIPDAVHSYTIPEEMYTPLTQLPQVPAAAKSDITPVTELYQRSLLVQLLILLSCACSGSDVTFPAASGSNPQILQILTYINGHLQEDLNIDCIAEACFLNRSYLMHLFRRETGITLGTYITEKRLFSARSLIQAGISVTDAAMQSGFNSYSSFYRAYVKKFGTSPKMITSENNINKIF